MNCTIHSSSNVYLTINSTSISVLILIVLQPFLMLLVMLIQELKEILQDINDKYLSTFL